MRRISVSALVLLLLFVSPVRATVSGVRDPDDVNGPLDIKRIVHGHGNGDLLWHKVVMRQGWGAKDLRGDGEIRLYLSRDGEDRFDEVHISIDQKEGELRAWIFSYTEGSDFAGVGPSERIRLTRPNRRMVKVFFDKTWVQNRRDRYAWSAGSSYRNPDSTNCRSSCFDYAPGSDPDRLVHRL